MNLSEKNQKVKRQLADYLNRMSEKLSIQTKKRILVTVGILMGCICLAMMFEPFRNPMIDQQVIPHETKVPIVIVPPESNDALLSPEDYSMLLEFKQTMDSLMINDRGSYEEILNGREGLMDSINFLIRLFR